MTATIDEQVDLALGYSPDEAADLVIAPGFKQCAREVDGVRCEEVFKPFNAQARYCPAHQPGKRVDGSRRGQPAPGSTNVTVNLGGAGKDAGKGKVTKEDAIAARVEAGSLAMLGLVPVVFAAIGDEPCAATFTTQLPAICHQLGEVARYHPALEKIFVSTSGSGEFVAWLGLAIATTPALVAVLTHHGVVTGSLADRLESVVTILGGAGARAD